MKIEYICHSALFIQTKDTKILTDPWLKGPAYCNQWHLFPKPINTFVANHADVILFTHGHEDHLHHESLLELNKSPRVFYPFQWQTGIKEYMAELGFSSVTEAISHKSYKLGTDTTITYIANALDSIIIIESDGEVLVNINDALPANHRNIIAKFIDQIKKRWPKIDYLFCGYGSAAYFPNTVHCEGKDDWEVAEAREQLFGDNFCYIVDQLKPVNTIPFAADYVLLNDQKRWINNVKYSKKKIQKYYEEVYKGAPTHFINAHSGDIIERNRFTQVSAYHELEAVYSLDQLIERDLQDEIKSVNDIGVISETEAQALMEGIRKNVSNRSGLFSENTLSRVHYTIRVTDIEKDNCFSISFNGNDCQLTRTNAVAPGSILVLETTSKILNYSFGSEWGGDAIVIGYGAEITILDKSILKENLDIVCVRLLTNQPVASKQMKASPGRAIKFLATNPLTTKWAIQQVIKGRKNVNKNPVNERDLWLAKSKCEICQVCNIPMLSNDFAETIK